MNQKQRIAFIKLNSPSQQLLESVEKLYGKEVKVEEVKDTPYSGQSDIMDDGTPRIRVNVVSPSKELTIVHELFHLKLRKSGFAGRYLMLSTFELNQASINRVTIGIREPILHSIFYPEMRKMGLDPNANARALYKNDLQNGVFDKINDQTIRALVYMQILLETDDQQLLAEFEQRMRANRWKESLDKGKKLAQIIQDSKPQSPDEEVSTFIKCANTLFEGQYSFEFLSWKEDKKKGDHVDRVARIFIQQM